MVSSHLNVHEEIMDRIGISSLYLVNRSFKKLLSAIKRIQAKYWEVVDEDKLKLNKRRVKLLKEIAEKYGIKYAVHAPFSDTNIASFNESIRKITLKQIMRSIKYASEIRALIVIIHPGMKSGLSTLYPNRDYRINFDSLVKILDFAEEKSVNIALENMPSMYPWLYERVEEFEQLFGELKDRYSNFGIALDVGHANTLGNLSTFTDRLSNQIIHVHLHDNDGIFDGHLPLGRGALDWRSFLEKAKKFPLKGFLSLETTDPVRDYRKVLRYLDLSN